MSKTLAVGRALVAVLVIAGALALVPRTSSANAVITIVNNNLPNVGFNDPTPVAPVGGNPGTTLGQQRLIAFQFAADKWGATLDSKVPITILASFEPLACTATGATLGSAGALSIWSDFPGATAPNTWHGVALANKLAGFDLDPATSDLRARFNVNLGLPGCLTGIGWYLGLDANHGTQIDLVTVLLHEFAHGLGFQQFASVSTGAEPLNLPDVYNKQLLDLTVNKTWDQMTDVERKASAINFNNVVWTGSHVTAAVPQVLGLGRPLLNVLSPASVAGSYPVGTASFGPALSSPGITGEVVLATDPADASGPSTTDGCSPITNNVAGKIALVDRGTCTFVVKVKNAQNAGAIAVIVADNAVGSPPAGLGGADPTITIPAVRITLGDGNAIKAALLGGPVTATLGVDLSVRAGATAAGQAIMNAPNPVQPGSSISHWDPIAFPNQLMEPAINADLTHNVDVPFDMTLPLLRDVGWYPDADLDMVADDVDCEPNSDFSPTIAFQGCDTGVPNKWFPTGCTIIDVLNHLAADAANHGDFVSMGSHYINSLRNHGDIPKNSAGTIIACLANSSVGNVATLPGEPSPTTLGTTVTAAEPFGVRLAGQNPSRSGALVQLSLPARGPVEMGVYDVRGALVWRMNARAFEPGRHLLNWNGTDLAGRTASPGMYFVRVSTPDQSALVRIAVVR